jgi:hypothetical protein
LHLIGGHRWRSGRSLPDHPCSRNCRAGRHTFGNWRSERHIWRDGLTSRRNLFAATKNPCDVRLYFTRSARLLQLLASKHPRQGRLLRSLSASLTSGQSRPERLS